MLSIFKKIRNWITFGEFISIFIIAYKCDGEIKTLVIECKSWAEAYSKARDIGSKMSCDFKIVDIVEY